MSTLESRVTHLERQNRRLRTALSVGLIGVLAAVLMAAATNDEPAEIIRCKRLVVGNPGNGKPYFVIDSGGLLLNNAEGKPRATLGLVADGVTFDLRDKMLNPRIRLIVADNPAGRITELEAHVAIDAPGGRKGIILAASKDIRGLIIHDTAGDPRVLLGTNGQEVVRRPE